MSFGSGINGTAFVDVTELPITDWSVDNAAEIVQFRNSKTGTFENLESTYTPLSASVTLDWDFAANPFAAPTTIRAGSTLTNVKLYLHRTGSYWDIPSAKVVGTPQRLEVAGKITTTVNIRANGPWTAPA